MVTHAADTCRHAPPSAHPRELRTTSTAPAPRPPAGRYGPEPRPGAHRARVVVLAALGAVAVAVAAWWGLASGTAPVTWKDVGFSLEDGAVRVTYDVSRPDPSVPVECRLQALNQQHAQVGVLVVTVPAADVRTQRLSSRVAVSEPAVTAVVESCWAP